jgi:4-diphosphocytidyl-2-C-methyl-D-erythritol kinase
VPSLPPSSVTVRAPAKVNLGLSVGSRREDGYHDLVNVFQAVSLTDEVTVRAAPEATGTTVTVTGEIDGVPLDGENLAVQAALLLARSAGRRADLELTIRKGIPVAGGMAGGSADAAAALLACDALWGTGCTRGRLLELAAELGADVPFALMGGTAVGMGRGDRLTAALGRGSYHWVLALADGGLSTPAVYAEVDRLREDDMLPEPDVSDTLMSALRAGDAVALGRALHNDLQPAAISLRPRLRATLEVGREQGVLGAVVCGSGPTCAFLVRDAEAALDLAVVLSASGVCRTVKRARGPVPGARVVAPGER